MRLPRRCACQRLRQTVDGRPDTDKNQPIAGLRSTARRDAELAVVSGTSHALIMEKPALCNQIMIDFLTGDPVPTFLPIRRA